MVCKDRTNELHQIMAAIRATNQIPMERPTTLSKREQLSKFQECASYVTGELQDTAELLGKLTQLIQRRSVFDDHSVEVTELSAVIKGKIGRLSNDLQQLQALKDQHRGWAERQADKHSTTVVTALRSQLLDTTKDFKDVLQVRNQTMRETTTRRSNFASDPLAEGLFVTRPGGDGEDDGGDSGAQMMFAAQGRDLSYYSSRADAVRQLEGTITEISAMFQEFARILSQQEELVLRIDDDVSSALTNVNKGQSELLTYLNRLSSNRWLIIKVFGILFFFVIFFGLFILK